MQEEYKTVYRGGEGEIVEKKSPCHIGVANDVTNGRQVGETSALIIKSKNNGIPTTRPAPIIDVNHFPQKYFCLEVLIYICFI